MTTNLLGRASGFESTVTTQRLGGQDRYETASLLSAASFAPGVDVAYVATGLNFPDALAASAVSRGRGPVLLVETNAIPQVVQDELIRLVPRRVVVAGSAAVVSDAVLTQLRTLTGADVVRKSGSDRYATAAEISEDAFSPGGTCRVRGHRPDLSRRPGGPEPPVPSWAGPSC
jgi:putative cell wall-binding protein